MTPIKLAEAVETIPLSQCKFAIVDAEDFEWLNKWKWYCHTSGYAARRCTIKNKIIYMHRMINNTPEGKETDHINNNKSDNRKSNLRNCTHRQNIRNMPKISNTSSKYRGVYWHKRDNKWISRIETENKRIHLGSFISEIEAAIAYNAAAINYFGEFAKLNEVAAWKGRGG